MLCGCHSTGPHDPLLIHIPEQVKTPRKVKRSRNITSSAEAAKAHKKRIRNRLMKVEIHLLSQSQPIVRESVTNAYNKEGMYCVYIDYYVEKYPLTNIFRVKETY